jgi:penicillin-binding protein 1B
MVTDMLQGVIDHGTARAAKGSVRNTVVAGKTGTSRDGWFVGYTPNLVCAVWIGFDDNRQLGLTGAEAALPVWTEFIRNAVDLRPELGGRAFAQPQGITIAEIDPSTDGLATGKCPMHEKVALLTTQAPTSDCFRHNIYFDLLPEVAAVENSPLAKPEAARVAMVRRRVKREQFDLLRDTQVETSGQGRKTLVNDMRATR